MIEVGVVDELVVVEVDELVVVEVDELVVVEIFVLGHSESLHSLTMSFLKTEGLASPSGNCW